MPSISQPQMTVNDYLCVVQPSFTSVEEIGPDDADSDASSENDLVKSNIIKYAHAFCTDFRPSGEPIWLKFQ